MANNGDVMNLGVLANLFCGFQGVSSELNGIRRLGVVTGGDHAPIGNQAIAPRLAVELAAAVCDDEFVGIQPLIKHALIAGNAIHIAEPLVGDTSYIERLTSFPRSRAAFYMHHLPAPHIG